VKQTITNSSIVAGYVCRAEKQLGELKDCTQEKKEECATAVGGVLPLV
jgi:hypothetical protein